MKEYFSSFMDNTWSNLGSFFGKFESPLNDFFNYKPSHYNYYDDEKPKIDEDDPENYSKYYNDNYGNRIR